MPIRSSLLLAAALAAAPAIASAALYEAEGGVSFFDLGGGDVEGDFLDLDGDGVDVSLTGSLLSGVVEAVLLVSDAATDEVFLSSSSVLGATLAPGGGGVEVVFGSLSGTVTNRIGRTATAFIQFDLADVDDGVVDPVTVTIEAAPIPLPATLPALALGLGALGLVARRRRR